MTNEDSSNNPTWDDYSGENTGYLADLKGVTFPSTAPDFSEDPRRGRHSSDEDALQATDPHSQTDIRRFCEKSGQRLKAAQAQDGAFTFWIEKTR